MNVCEKYAALLDLYVDGELSLEEMLEVQTHLEECPACQSYVDDAMAMRAAFPDAEETEVPEDFAAGVMAKIQAQAAPSVPRKKKTPWVGMLASLAACCAIVIIQQNGPLASRSEEAAPAAAFDAVAEEACDDAAPEMFYTTTNESAVETESAPAEPAAALADGVTQNGSIQARIEEAPAELDKEKGTGNDAPAESFDAESGAGSSEDAWVEHENVVFACVVYLPSDRVGDTLDSYEGKPYSNAMLPDEGVIGTGYALEQAEFERLLYDEFDYLHGPELNQGRTTELCCIVVTDNEWDAG